MPTRFICVFIPQSSERLKEKKIYHKLDGVEEALVELCVLEVVLWVVRAVHHPTRAAGHCSKLLLTCVLIGEKYSQHTQEDKRTKVQ